MPEDDQPLLRVEHPHVRMDHRVFGGSPYVAGSRVPVRRILAFYQSGTSVEKIIKRYPQLSPSGIFDALSFALDNPGLMAKDMNSAPPPLKGPRPRCVPEGCAFKLLPGGVYAWAQDGVVHVQDRMNSSVSWRISQVGIAAPYCDWPKDFKQSVSLATYIGALEFGAKAFGWKI